MTTTDPEVLIAGAGPTGLLLALWLVRDGVRVRIVDPKAGPTQETRAIVVQARTLEFYDQLGLGAEALKRGRHFDAVSLWVRGRDVGDIQLHNAAGPITPHPYAYILTQDQNEAMLLAHLEALGAAVEWETELIGFVQDAEGVTATLQHAGQAVSVRAAYLAGCDGAHSAVRHGIDAAFPGSTYAQTFYVADVTATGKLHAGDVNLGLDDTRFLAFFPMPQPDRHRVLGLVPAGAGEHPDFEAVRPEVEAHGLARVQQVHWFATYRVHHRVAERFRKERVFLLGDAGHVHSPVGGQGMNTGLGDAVNLAWKLAQSLRGNPAVLSSYEPERVPFAQTLVNTTDRVFTGIVNPAALARFIRSQGIPAVFPLLSRLSIVSKLLFLTVSQIRIAYPKSPLSVGRAGRVRGGDRLPWVRQANGSNFDALAERRWQLHIYGTPEPEVRTWCDAQGVSLHTFPFGPAARRAGLAEGALYLVRPDGYVGLAARRFDPAQFTAYARRWLART